MGALPFYIVCGLKGNEWAYEKITNKNIQLFHSNQKIQAIVWAVIIPTISIILFMSGIVFLYKFATNYAKSHPNFANQAIEYYVNTQSKAAMAKFDKIELGKNEYKFYIDPKKWINSSYKEKVADFDMASGYVMLQTLENGDITETFSATATNNIMNKIKIYSTYNDELLGEYYLAPESIKNLREDQNNPQTRRKILEELKNGYRFNTHPTLP